MSLLDLAVNASVTNNILLTDLQCLESVTSKQTNGNKLLGSGLDERGIELRFPAGLRNFSLF